MLFDPPFFSKEINILRASPDLSGRVEKFLTNKGWKWFVYIVECLDNTFYTGITWCADIREQQHRSGTGSAYTKKHGFRKLAYVEEYDNFEEARLREKQIKDLNQEKKRKLINGEWQKWG